GPAAPRGLSSGNRFCVLSPCSRGSFCWDPCGGSTDACAESPFNDFPCGVACCLACGADCSVDCCDVCLVLRLESCLGNRRLNRSAIFPAISCAACPASICRCCCCCCCCC